MVGSSTKEGVSMAGKEDETYIGQADAAGPEVTDEAAAGPDVADESGPVEATRKSTEAKVLRVSVSVRTVVVATLIAGLLASVGVLTWLYIGAKAKLDEEARQAANNHHAEQIALDYAVDAAKINVQDLDTWKKNLVKGTTRELKEKLSSAANAMDQILVPMQWNSTATPLVAKVRSNTNGIYVIDSFVGVQTKTVQAPDGLQSTATYSITIDSNHDWQISDVGGIAAVVGQK
jgi:type II secretory pathway pseudopilin PulG